MVHTRFMGELDSRRSAFVAWMAANQLNVSRVAKAAGVPATTLYDFVRGDTQSLKADTEAKIALAFKCDSAVIFKGEQRRDEERPIRQIPVVGYVGAASEFFGFDDHAMGAGLDLVDAPPGVPEHAVAAIVRGDSGYPAIRDGMVLVYWDKHEDPSPLIGEDCFVRVSDGRTLVKILERGTEDGTFTLVSINSATPPIRNVRLDWAAPIEVRLRRLNWNPR